MLKAWIRARKLRHTVPNTVSTPHPNIMLCQPVLKRGYLLKNDTPKSGFLEMGELLSDGSDLRRQLYEECKRILGSDIGTLNAMHLVHNYPYSKSPFINLLRPAVPRFFFADRAPPGTSGANCARKYNDTYTVWRYDYGSGSGTGSVATNESYRVIAPMPTSFTNLHQAIYKKLQQDPRFKSLVRDGKNKFNHATVLTYRGHNHLTSHTDQVWAPTGKFVSQKNSQKEGSPVVIVTIGDPRKLLFLRRSSNGKRWDVAEKVPFMTVQQHHLQVFVLHPRDERPLRRHDWMGKRKEKVQFTHRVDQPQGREREGYLSVAILFRCVTKTCPVDVRYNTVAVDERTVNGYDRAPVKKRVAKRKAAQDMAMANKRSRESNTVREWNEFLRWKCEEIFD